MASALQVRGMEVGCEVPHIPSILRMLRMGSVPLDLYINLHIYILSGWASDPVVML